jgi:multidrug resistance protein MdtO
VPAGAIATRTTRTQLFAFLKTELAPTPGRERSSMRVLVASLVSVVLVMVLHPPHGHWIIITIFTVSPEDAGASLVRGVQRVLGTVAGGLAGTLIAIAFADEPPFMFVAIAVTVAVGMFFSRTTSAPYASLLATVTLLLVAVSHLDSPGAEVEAALWRTFMILIGVVLGTGAQVLLWPHDPEARLLDDLVERLAAVERLLADARRLPGEGGRVEGGVVAMSGFARELDLLANAEARYPSLRRRHPEQIALITEIERLLTSALWLVELVRDPAGPHRIDVVLAQRLAGLTTACARVRVAVAARRAVEEGEIPHRPDGAEARAAGLFVLIAYMESTLGRVAAATAFLHPHPAARAGQPPLRSPLDTPARAPFFTHAFSFSNTADVKFALKCALAIEICFVVILGLDWPGLLTSTVTCALVAQSSLGASIYKALLRLAGTVLGGLLGLIMIAVVMPNAQSLVWLMVPLAFCFWIAAWITAGSSRISYAGIQTGMALAICVVDVFGPTTDLVPPRDRVLGMLLGVAVMGLVFQFIWPERASRAMRPALASALRAMAVLAVLAPLAGYALSVARAARHRASVYRALERVLRLREEAALEPGATAPTERLERDRILDLTADAQAVFLALLALARHRLSPDAAAVPDEAVPRLEVFDRGVRRALELTASSIERPAAGPAPDFSSLLEPLDRVDAALASAPTVRSDARTLAHLTGEISIRREVLREVLRLQAQASRVPT